QENLVPNPSFEQYDSCPRMVGGYDDFYVSQWQKCNGTPDYINRCATETTLVSVPCNAWGCQEPATGNGYVGVIGLGPSSVETYREIVGTQLTEPLTVGQTYYVSFKAS